jgi:branched-chain amino acid transport system permease protein
VNIVVWIVVAGFFSAAVGVLFGLPSLRIKGFYLAWRRSPRSSS